MFIHIYWLFKLLKTQLLIKHNSVLILQHCDNGGRTWPTTLLGLVAVKAGAIHTSYHEESHLQPTMVHQHPIYCIFY